MSKLPVNTTEFWKQRIADSRKYGDIHHSVYISNNRAWRLAEEAHRDILAPYKDKKVLDAGCGYGRMSQYFTNYTGVDLSPDFIELAKEKFRGDFMVGDLANLPFKDKEFDMAFCISIKGMLVGNLGTEAWTPVERELVRVAKEVIILEYENDAPPEVLR